jgi:8-oxo-dGTP pyrophosphatase MutT (NUDIX family)
MKIRRGGSAIVEMKGGMLVVSTDKKNFMLPGGGARKFETRKKAAIRELYEETGLKTSEIKYLLHYTGGKGHNYKRNLVINDTKVFVIKSKGDPRPRNEIKSIKFWKPNSKIALTAGSKNAIYFYLKNK